jgi:hypothetical protein
MLIKKNSINFNVPNNDLRIISGHKVLIDGKDIKVKPQMVYSICVDEHKQF